MKEQILDVLADRYASTPMVAIWSPTGKVRKERELWVAVLKAQQELGLPIPSEAILAYELAIGDIDLNSIKKREAITRHDVKARIEEFNALSGYELIHQGFTSRDITDPVEQLQIFESMQLVRDRTVALLNRLAIKAAEYSALDICGRSHNVPGQTTTLGKRFSNCAEEIINAFNSLEGLIQNYQFRGVKGAMGTQQDMADLLGDNNKVFPMESKIKNHLGLPHVLTSVGQVYPRSMDFEVLALLAQLASGPGNLAKSIRLMAGHGLLHEGFGKDQSGSTAMPHKVNSRTCERINSLGNVLGGFLDMTKGLLGDQWLEGDVSCSVVHRVALPGAFFAIDGILESTMTVLDEMQIFPGMIKRELEYYLPFLSTTRILVALVKHGVGRETAHTLIKKHAMESMDEIRNGGNNTFLNRLLGDPSFPLSRDELSVLTSTPNHGLAEIQVRSVCGDIEGIVNLYPEAANYNPEPIR